MRLLVIDLEATCWRDASTGPNGEPSEVIEVGYCMIEKDRLGGAGTRLVRPKLSTVSEFCTELTTLTQEMVDTGFIEPTVAVQSIMRELGVVRPDRQVYASWGEFDHKMLRQAGVFLGRHLNLAPMYGFLTGRSKSGGLKDAVDATVGWSGTHHRGDADALNAARLALWMMENFDLGKAVKELVK